MRHTLRSIPQYFLFNEYPVITWNHCSSLTSFVCIQAWMILLTTEVKHPLAPYNHAHLYAYTLPVVWCWCLSRPGASIPQQPRRYSPSFPPFSPFPIPPFPLPSPFPFPLLFPLPLALVLPSLPSISLLPWSGPFETSYRGSEEHCKLLQWVWAKPQPTSILMYSEREKLIWQQLLYGFLYTEVC